MRSITDQDQNFSKEKIAKCEIFCCVRNLKDAELNYNQISVAPDYSDLYPEKVNSMIEALKNKDGDDATK